VTVQNLKHAVKSSSEDRTENGELWKHHRSDCLHGEESSTRMSAESVSLSQPTECAAASIERLP
jgi:hypothetical protein